MKKIICIMCFAFTCGFIMAQDNIEKGEGSVRFVDNDEQVDDSNTLDLALQSPKLTVIPDYVFEKTNLVRLDLGYNRIGKISEKILNLTKLEVLILSGNQYLTELPDFLAEMKSLKTIYLQGMGTWSEQKKKDTVARFKEKGIEVITQKMQ